MKTLALIEPIKIQIDDIQDNLTSHLVKDYPVVRPKGSTAQPGGQVDEDALDIEVLVEDGDYYKSDCMKEMEVEGQNGAKEVDKKEFEAAAAIT